ncbi:MAG: T9SS type A sorting domain-containing protein [Chitinophagaceae bacterium]|nr:T9SS type A sorting domain-containing protein [Chitinophagaceae bacterium]
MKNFLHIILMLFPLCGISQNKMGYTWIVGNNASFGKFDGSSNTPTTGSLYTMAAPNYPYIFGGGHSNICDSATGKLLFLCNGMQVFDTLGNILENGDSLVPPKFYKHNAYPGTTLTQSSLIIPKGNNGLYYVFIPTISDSKYTYWLSNPLGDGRVPFDLLLYHVVDMNANGGAGKVIEKNKLLLENTELHKTMMQACKHSNGVDWWLLKQGAYGTNEIIRFLVTKDSIYGPYVQQFSEPAYVTYDMTGQFAFNTEGTQFAAVQGKTNKLFLADFDRCTGELNNPKVFNIPIDSTGYPILDNQNWRDTMSTGVCFSPNNHYIYIAKKTNIYQFEFTESDSLLAWYNVKRGADTTWNAFENYGLLSKGPDSRIYIGKGNGGFKQFSVINNPNSKGAACGFCRKCFRVDNALGGLNSPPNMPDYTLGPSNKTCWPLATNQLSIQHEALEVYPNPSSSVFYIKNKQGKKKELFTMLGELLFTTTKDEIEVSRYSKGVYYLLCEQAVRKVVVE